MFLIWIVAAVWLVAAKWKAIGLLALPDTDDNMRLQQVRDWIAGQPWYDLSQHRMDPPNGGEMHWSRLVDLPLAGIILALKAWLPIGMAERVAVTVAPLLPLGAAMLALTVTIRRVIAPSAWALAPAVLMCAAATVNMMTPLRIDHHGWQIALVLMMVTGFVTMRAGMGGALAGLATALSMAIGVETLPYLAMGGATIILLWIIDPAERRRLLAYGGMLGLSAPLALALFLPPDRWFLPICDGLSSAYIWVMTLAGAGAVGLAMLTPARVLTRLGAALGLAALLLLFEYQAYPQCLSDPYGNLTDELKQLWLSNVREARPIYRQSAQVILVMMALPVIGMLGAAWATWRNRRDHTMLLRWAAIVLMTAFGLILCLFQTRAAPLAQALSVPGAAWLIWAVIMRMRDHASPLLRVVVVVSAFLIFSGIASVFLVKLIPASNATSNPQARGKDVACGRAAALAPLGALPPGTILTMLDLGPRLIVHSHHSVIAGPYHRNGPAIVDLMHAWGGTPDEARAIIDRHLVSYVLICPGASETGLYVKRAKNGFYARLARGETPDWLTPVPLPKGNPYRLWKVDQPRLARTPSMMN